MMETRRQALVRRFSGALAVVAALAVAGAVAGAAGDTVQGTLTVKGKTLVLKNVYVKRAANPDEPGSKYLIVVASDLPVPESSRTRAGLTDLAKRGGVHAVEVMWKEGVDYLVATPFHSEVEHNGQPTVGGATIDLQAYNDRHVTVKIASRPVGQIWHFSATVDAAVVPATLTADDFLDPSPIVSEPTDVERDTKNEKVEKDERTDPTSMKEMLGRLGFVYDDGGFLQSVNEGNLQAVRLFLKLGMSADTISEGMPLLMSAVMHCASNPAEGRGDIVKALLAAHAKVDPKDENGSTPLLWSVNIGCPTDIVRALITAGANVNAKAKGGATPLMLAQAMNRGELVTILKAAGAKP